MLPVVEASAKDCSIIDPIERTNDLVRRCADAGRGALIVKSADTLDSFAWYTNTNDKNEIERCLRNA